MNSQLVAFPDFHVGGASAPEWNQRYLQMTPGLMRSALLEWSGNGVHVFRKWISERVVQQGSLPHGQLCFAMLGKEAAGVVRVQGRELGVEDVLVLRDGQEFEIQRPAGVELLSVTFGASSFFEFLDASQAPADVYRAMAGVVIRPRTGALRTLVEQVREQLSAPSARGASELMHAARNVLAVAPAVRPQRESSIAAARLVKESHQIAFARDVEQPVQIDDLCHRLRTSRRTLQNSFNRVTGAPPVVYMRNIRLNAVRRRLMATSAGELSVSTAAVDAGFDHLGHFAGNYKQLFGELPSLTARASAARDR